MPKARKHTKALDIQEQEKFPKSCELCDKEIRSNIEFKQHMKTHSYKLIDYRCAECDFMGSSEATMEIHMGKIHCEKIECGMCDNIFNDLGTLETHLSTCEIYKCDECSFITSHLSEMKVHLDDQHSGGKGIEIIHSKQSRANREEYDCKYYTKSELFPRNNLN